MYTKEQNKILTEMYPNAKLSVQEFENKFNVRTNDDTITPLSKDRLLITDGTVLNSPIIKLTEKGKAYVENYLSAIKEKNYARFRDNITLCLAAIGVILSIFALLK